MDVAVLELVARALDQLASRVAALEGDAELSGRDLEWSRLRDDLAVMCRGLALLRGLVPVRGDG